MSDSPRLLAWLAANRPDVICLQETKLEDHKFPVAELAAAGYDARYSGQKTYNGVAILAREGLSLDDLVAGIPGFRRPAEDASSPQRSPAFGSSISTSRTASRSTPTSIVYKLEWCAAAAGYLRNELSRHAALAVMGDFNVAPEDRDVHDPALWAGQVLCSEPERAAFREFLAAGLQDSFRLFDQPPATFSWWDYRMLAFPKNRGLRIDHILLSPPLAARCTRQPHRPQRAQGREAVGPRAGAGGTPRCLIACSRSAPWFLRRRSSCSCSCR